MNRTLIYSLCAITAIFVTTVASRSASSAGQGTAIVRLQSSTPGAAQSGHANLTGTVIAGQFQGGGAGLTSLNAGNLASGTLLDARLSANVTLLNGVQTISGAKTFSGAPSFTAAGTPFMVTGTTVVTNLNADLLDGQHGAFYQSAANLSGTLPDARLSTNVALLGSTQTFSALKIFGSSFQVPGGGGAGKFLMSDAVGVGSWSVLPPPSGAAGGDLSGTYPNPLVDGLQGRAVAATAPTTGQVLGWNGTTWTPAATTHGHAGEDITSGTVADARLSANVALLSNSNSFVGNVDRLSSTAFGSSFASNSGQEGIWPNSVVTMGKFAFVLNEGSGSGNSSLRVVDISSPNAITNLGSVALGSQPMGLAAAGRYCYVADSGPSGLRLIDVSNPSSPASIGFVSLPGNPYAVAVSGRYAYVGCINTDDGLQVVDIGRPNNLAVVGYLHVGKLVSLTVQGRYVYGLGDNHEFRVIDVSTPTAPVLTGQITTTVAGNDIKVAGRYAFVGGSGPGGLSVFDVSNPASPTLLTSVAGGDAARETFAHGRYVSIVTTSGHLKTYDVINPATPVLVNDQGGLGNPYGLAISGKHAYVTNLFPPSYGALNSIDIRGIETSSLIAHSLDAGTLNVASNATIGNNLSVSGGIVVGSNGLFVDGGASFKGSIGASSFSFPDGTSITSGASYWSVSGNNISNTNSGNVGIGTASPSELLELRGGGGPTSLLFAPGKWYGTNTANKAQIDIPGTGDLLFWDNVNVNNVFTAGSKLFEIDHPLDPLNKFLRHGCIESDELKNLYDGTVTTDAKGYATVTVPDWFTALNEKFRYQVTVIDAGNDDDFVMAKITRELEDQSFTLRTSKAHTKVSWQITGVRKDAFAKANPLIVEEEKPKAMRGKYIHPEAFAKQTP